MHFRSCTQNGDFVISKKRINAEIKETISMQADEKDRTVHSTAIWRIALE